MAVFSNIGHNTMTQPLDKPLAAPVSDFSMKIVGNMMENYQTD